MIWPLGAERRVELGPHMPRILRKSLQRNGFQTDGQACPDLLQVIGGFLEFVSERFADEVGDVLVKHPTAHAPNDLVSWVVGDLDQFISYALQIFQRRLVDHLSIDFGRSRSIACAEAMSGRDWLPHIYLEAAHEWRRVVEVPIRSRRFQRKRAQHEWTPRLVDLPRLVREYFG